MKLRRFTGPTMAAVLASVREALGPDAMILETRSLAAGGRGVEVTAAVDDAPAPAVAPTSADAVLADEVRRLSELVRALVMQASSGPSGRLAPELGHVYAALLGAGVDGLIAAAFIEQAAARMACGAGLDAALAEAAERGVSFSDATCPARARRAVGGPRVSIFFGPPGDGKTTTIAKLAGRATVGGQRRVALVSADTYRIGGAEELGAYARILGAAHAAVGSASELRRALEGFGDVDDVFVDTAGVAAADADRRTEIRALADGVGSVHRTLVLSATTAPLVGRRVCDALAELRPDACIITKIDEAPAHGTLGTLWGRSLPLTFFGTGRGVPRDLEAASANRLAAWLRAA
jgi:flagellar biosynthesis protein FlhF